MSYLQDIQIQAECLRGMGTCVTQRTMGSKLQYRENNIYNIYECTRKEMNIPRRKTTTGEYNYVVTSIQSKKQYDDSVHRKSLMNARQKFWVDDTSRNLIKQTVANAVTKVKFMGVILEPFTIKTGLGHKATDCPHSS